MSQQRQWQRQRDLMVADQLCARGIIDQRVLDIMGKLPREHFMPEGARCYAYQDNPVLIGEGQTISQPYIVALMSEKLDVGPSDTVLEIGTGCGYQTAILAKLGERVYTIERLGSLANLGRKNLEELEIENVEFLHGDGARGWPQPRQFDRILVAAAAEKLPAALWEQLADGGKMVAPVGQVGSQQLLLMKKQGDQRLTTLLCYCRFVPLMEDYQ